MWESIDRLYATSTKLKPHERTKKLPTDEFEETSLSRRDTTSRWILTGVLIVLYASLSLNGWLLYRQTTLTCSPNPHRKSYFGLAERSLVERMEGYWSPEWDPEVSKRADVDALWNSTTDGFGVVQLDHDWAAEKGLARSENSPTDDSKGLYVIPVYHALHCLRSLRLYFHRAANGVELKKYWIAHGYHCHEVIRQELMCSATDTLVGRLRHHRIGEGEVRQCSDWEYIQNWAAENTAGYIEDANGKPAYLGRGEDSPKSGGWHTAPKTGLI